MSASDDERTGRLLVGIRRRAGLTQRDVAAISGVPRMDIIRIEAGEAGIVRLDRARRVFAAVGGRARLALWWEGASADRIIDERHAALVERALAVFHRRGWDAAVEVSFSVFGERGSIDILGARRSVGAIAVCEVKSDLPSIEETNRTLDMKVRLGPQIARDRFGWRPTFIGRLLIVAESSTNRRLVESHAETMASAYPARSRDVREWLRSPVRPLQGIWFLSEVPTRDRVPPPRAHLSSPGANRDRGTKRVAID